MSEVIRVPVYGWAGRYEVSSDGKFYRIVGGRGTRLGRELGTIRIHHGYRNVRFRSPGRTEVWLAHRVVVYSFLGEPESQERSFVNHKNGVKYDNRIENLEFCSMAENTLHSYRVLGRKVVRTIGEAQGRSKLTDDKVRELRDKYKSGDWSQDRIAAHLGVSQCLVSQVLRGVIWTHVT